MRAMAMVGAVLVLAAATGCAGGALEGEWENEESDSQFKDDLTFFDETSGERTISLEYPVYCGDDLVTPQLEITFDVQVKERGDNDYEVEFECSSASISGSGGCSSVYGCGDIYEILGFSMDIETDCELNDDETELECEFEGEDFTFERIGE